MTVQLNFDKINQQRLLPLLEWLREIGLVKSYSVSGGGPDSQLLNHLVKKDETGTLASMSLKELERLVLQARERVIPTAFDTPDEEQANLITAIAARLYDDSVLSAAKAATLAGMSKADFIRQLGKFQVSSFGETVEEISAL